MVDCARMTFDVQPPIFATDQIRAMKPNTDILLAGHKAASIKAIASRMGRLLRRKYRTAKEQSGVRVWRLK